MKLNKTLKALLATSVLAAAACTANYEDINRNPYEVSGDEMDRDGYAMRSFLTTMQSWVVPTDVNQCQFTDILLAGVYGGYFADANADFNSNSFATYLPATNWSEVFYETIYQRIIANYFELLDITTDENAIAVAKVIKVMGLSRVADVYGPIPYTALGTDVESIPLDSEETVYRAMFADLNEAIAVLTANRTQSIIADADRLYGGSLEKWCKLANSLKLRLAMRIRYVDPTRAAQYAQEAIDGGVITATSDNAYLASYRQISVNNPLEMMWGSYNDARMSASMDSFLNGYEDPRRAAMFQPSPLDGQFHGVRNGLGSTEQKFYTNMSAPNIYGETPMRWLLASEVAFLKAEYYLTKSQSADAKSLYEEGIRLSFVENGLSASEAAAYAASDKRPGRFNDSSENPTKYSTNALSSVTVKWADDGNELERIITQKWIALFPNGMEAWAEFRRTGFPRIFPILENSNDPSINKNTQIRRVIFPKSEYSNNAGAVNAAARLLKGGADTGGARLWWDAK